MEKFNGDAKVYYNKGQGDNGGSFMYSMLSAAFNGSVDSTCQNFPDMDGNGRTDL